MPPAFLRSVLEDGGAEGDDLATRYGVQDFEEGYEEGVEAGKEAYVAADFSCAVAEVSWLQAGRR